MLRVGGRSVQVLVRFCGLGVDFCVKDARVFETRTFENCQVQICDGRVGGLVCEFEGGVDLIHFVDEVGEILQ